MNQNNLLLLFCFFVTGPLITPSVLAQSWVDEGAREFEELRLQQLQTVQKQNKIAPFTTDGCSGNLSSTWEILAETFPGFEQQFGNKPPWESCCVTHDKVYWRGVVTDGYMQRKRADEALRKCVTATGDKLAPQLSLKYSITERNIHETFAVIADLMYRAVRLGGQPCSLLPWRWGYGWPNCAFSSVSDIPTIYSDIKPDEHVTFFNTAGWLDADNAHWYLPVHGWIYEPEDSVARIGAFAKILESQFGLKATSKTEANFKHRTNLLIADNERDKTLVIRMAGQDFTLPESVENGHFVTTLKLPAEHVNAFANQGHIHFFAVTQAGDERRFEGDIQLVSRHGISIISDIDDTIKVTNIADHKQLVNNTFFQDFKAVPGMAHLYQQLAALGATIHFVSSSPWQLYTPLQDFTMQAGFPWATMSLKYVRFRDESLLNLFRTGSETKPAQIEPILQNHPDRRFILIGDSGEEDPEVYGEMSRRYPAQICRILIRNVDDSTAGDERYKSAFRNIASSRWQLFNDSRQIVVNTLLACK